MTDETERVRPAYTARDQDWRRQDRYRLTNPSHLFLVQQRERRLLDVLARYGFTERLGHARILDVGCGSGGLLLDMVRYGARPASLAGLDLMPERIAMARARLPAADLRCASAAALPYADGAFDLVCQMTVLSTVLDAATRRPIAAEMARVVRTDGLIVWYDLRWNNPRNLAVHGIGLTELTALFPHHTIEAQPITLAAPLARLVVPRSWLLAAVLERLPPLRSDLLAGIYRQD